jgi:predicted phosphodiesterase
VAQAGGVNIYVLHDVKTLALDLQASEFGVVVSGHTHQLSRSERNGILYVNPGSAGPRRFSLPITVATLDLGVTPWTVEFVDLEKGRRVN